VENETPEVWECLAEVVQEYPVILNRAPTLHRLGMQAFEPILIEGKAIQLHPLVCPAFNADFDGDQMAVHVPLSVEAQLESRLLMLASNSIFSPASGKSIMTPTQDIALGIYYLTVPSQSDKLANRIAGKTPAGDTHLPLFNSTSEVDLALADGAINYHTRIRLRNPDFGIKGRRFGNPDVRVIETTAGRVIFNELWPDDLGFVNDKIDKSKLGDLILHSHQVAGHARTVRALDELKALGFKHACLAGVSMGLKDMIRPKSKEEIIAKAYTEVDKVDGQFQTGVITDGERHNKIVVV